MQELVNAIRDHKALLFVGAGVSMNLGIPSWRQLTDHIAQRLGEDPEEFAELGSDQTLAEYYLLQTGSLGPLRSWMDVEWHREAEEKVRRSEIHRLIVELGFPLIYTTNYDRYLEIAHDVHGAAYSKISSMGEMNRVHPSATQIVKLHGDFEDDGSIVLTESNHFDRLSLESPLDLKLRADLLSRVALFVGYSVSDIGIRYLLYRLHKLWEQSPSAQARPKSYVFLGRPNLVQARVLAGWGIVPLFSDEPDIGEALRQLLQTLVREDKRPASDENGRPIESVRSAARRTRKGRARGKKPRGK